MSSQFWKWRVLAAVEVICLAVLFAVHAVGTALILLAIQQFFIALILFVRDVRTYVGRADKS
jgi:hypothetical protein